MRVVEYVRPDGTSPFARWFKSLDAMAAAKVTTALSRIEKGNTSHGTKRTQFEDIRRAMALNHEYRERKRSGTGEA